MRIALVLDFGVFLLQRTDFTLDLFRVDQASGGNACGERLLVGEEALLGLGEHRDFFEPALSAAAKAPIDCPHRRDSAIFLTSTLFFSVRPGNASNLSCSKACAYFARLLRVILIR